MKALSLRLRLTLAFAALAVLPAAVVGWATLAAVNGSFDTMLDMRLDDTEALIRAETNRIKLDLDRAVTALAENSPSVREVTRTLLRAGQAPASSLSLAEDLLAGRRDLQVLFLIDDDGRVLSSGHLPARFGDSRPELSALAKERPGVPTLQRVEIRGEQGIERSLALLLARPAGDLPAPQAAMHVVGGALVDHALAGRLQALTGAEVRLLLEEGEALDEQAAGKGRRARRLPLAEARDGETGILEISVTEEALAKTRRQILLVLLVSVILAVAGAALLGSVLASRVTRPLDALAEGAGRISRGDYETRVQAQGSPEISALVGAFNSMMGEIESSRDRVVAAERVAAWQGMARRLAHEIKNPLTPIAMSIETLRRTWKRKHPDFEEIFDESTGAILEEVDA
ncbi:MAG: HAMP domain-containing protein, partial [Myxococcota bacterium]